MSEGTFSHVVVQIFPDYCLDVCRICNIIIIHLYQVDSSMSTLWTGLFLIEVVSCVFSLLKCFIEITVFNAKM